MEPTNNGKSCLQKRMGPAPFASFEDLSDEMDSPGEKEIAIIRLPGISEQEIPSKYPDRESVEKQPSSLVGSTLKTAHSTSNSPQTHSPLPNKMKLANMPRIDISRASSSSHHDSRDSSPEREIFESADANTVKLGLGFKEDDALELRLSTEELDFHDVVETKSHKYKHRSASPEFDELYGNNNRKNSQCSDVVLLSISGRTSRISSIGSQGSAQSRLSNASHISIISGQSAYSQCSSPHKTLLETSFCGNRGSQTNISSDHPESKDEQENIEKVLLARKSDPSRAVIASSVSKNLSQRNDISKTLQRNNELKPESTDGKAKLPRKIISKSGVEYIYIPLKGPLPVDDSQEGTEIKSCGSDFSKRKTKQGVSKTKATASAPTNLTTNKPQSQNTEPKYIRIRLKPDHCYDDYEGPSTSNEIVKPATLNLTIPQENHHAKREYNDNNNFNSIQHHARSLTNSPKLLRKHPGGQSTVPRRNSFVTLFRTGPDSPGTSKQKRKNTLTSCINYNAKNSSTSTHISSTESVDSKGKHKSVLSIFKFPRDKHKTSEIQSDKTRKVKSAEPKIRYKEEKRELPLSSESIRIPLHSPTYYEQKTILDECQGASQNKDLEVTVVEIIPQKSIVKQIETKVEIVKCDSNEEIINKTSEIVVETQVENNKTNITTVDIETTNIPAELSCSSISESTVIKTTETGKKGMNVDDHNSSESEREVELESDKSFEIERKAIVLQQDSFEDELPYVPTTLPQERSAAVPILPVKQRGVMEIKTCPIERPRSTTPIHSSGLETYFDGFGSKYDNISTPTEKLKISLPRADLPAKATSTKPRPLCQEDPQKSNDEIPPPLPPKGVQKSWINFEEVPERRKPPKRIQTIPSRGHIDITGLVKDNVVYTYVNPDECKCECHEHKETENKQQPVVEIQEDEVPLLNQDDKEGLVNR
ncbi:hypothetical protein ABEB36_005950 [Hypothenemus hampei]|uniref:Uncharacterized protein n=1 Tax=Hypothenemus hampei TaxID=57062 RepID=A0ABD1F3S7_HYPHA